MPYELEQLRGEAKEFLSDLTERDQRMMFAVVTLVHIADSLEQLDADTETLLSIGREHLCQFLGFFRNYLPSRQPKFWGLSTG